jgi:MFS family permease
MDRRKLWTRDFIIITFTNFFVVINYYLLMVTISAFAMKNYHSSPSQAGLASSIFVIGALVARLFSGKGIEKIGRKKMLGMGLISGLVMVLLYFGINSIMFLLVVRFLHGAAYGVTSTATGTIVLNAIPRERSGEGIGYYLLSFTLAMAIGPFLGMFISRHGSFSTIFAACAISALFSLASIFFLSVPEIRLTKAQLEELKGFNFKNFFETKAIPISIVCAVLYFCYSSVLSFIMAYAKEIHLAEAATFFFIVFAIAIFLSRPFTGRLFDLKGENFIMYPGIILFVIGMTVLSQAHYGYTLLLAGAFIGFGLGVVQSGGQAISVKVTPPHRLGLANSTFYIFIDTAIGLGPFLFGFFIPFSGYRGVYAGMSIIALACMFLYYLLHGKKAVLRKVVNIPANL